MTTTRYPQHWLTFTGNQEPESDPIHTLACECAGVDPNDTDADVLQRRLAVKPGSAADRRLQEEERDALIAELGMQPEEKTRDGRYAATTGELRGWLWAERRNK